MVEIVGKKTLGSVDFRQSWRTRLLFYRDIIHQRTMHWQGFAHQEIAGMGMEVGFSRRAVDTAFASHHPCDRVEISGGE